MSKLRFTRTVIGELDNEVGVGPMNTLFNVGDINSDGRPDIFTTGREGRVAWFENTGNFEGWKRHIIGVSDRQECGGLAYDLTGSGYPNIVNGGDWRSDQLSWWENPAPAGGEWKRHLITETGAGQFHDELIGDVTGNGVQYARLVDFRGIGVLDIASRPLHGPDKWKIFVWYGEKAAANV